MRHTRFSAAAALTVAAALLVSGCGPRYDVDDVRGFAAAHPAPRIARG